MTSWATEAADLAGARLAATPTDDFGADVARLRRVCEGYGFVKNAGEGRDWGIKEDYIRPMKHGQMGHVISQTLVP